MACGLRFWKAIFLESTPPCSLVVASERACYAHGSAFAYPKKNRPAFQTTRGVFLGQGTTSAEVTQLEPSREHAHVKMRSCHGTPLLPPQCPQAHLAGQSTAARHGGTLSGRCASTITADESQFNSVSLRWGTRLLTSTKFERELRDTATNMKANANRRCAEEH